MPELLTSLDVVNQSFKKVIRGYDSTEVDDFLDAVAETIQTYAQRTKDLERDLSANETKLAEYEKMKNVLHEALIMAQKSADDRIKSARDHASKIISDAEVKAEEIRSANEEERKRFLSDISSIKDIRDLYSLEFKEMLSKFACMLDEVSADTEVSDAAEEAITKINSGARIPDKERQVTSSSVEKDDLEAAYNLLGIDPKEILGD